MNDMDKIELRSEKVRKIIGDMPSGFYPLWYQHHYLHNYLSMIKRSIDVACKQVAPSHASGGLQDMS